VKKIVKVIFVLTKCRFDFKLVKKERLLVFDTLSLELVSKLKKFEVLDVRYKVFNFWILLENFLQFKFTFRDYILTFISKVNPKVVITFNDNYLLFFKLKTYFPKIKFIAVQNGYRHKLQLEDFKKFKNSKLSVDYFFTFGKNSEIFYKKFLKCDNFIELGSFRNNNIKLKKSTEKKNILFISQFRYKNLNKDDNFNFYSEIIIIINIFCMKKKIKLFVATASIKNYLEEKLFLFSKLPKKHNVYEIKKKKRYGNYSLINKFETIVFVDSTLGYEAIARNKKVIAISCRKDKDKITSPFGFPTNKKKRGFFFTNFNSKKEILRVLNNVYSLPKIKWLKNYQEKLDRLMTFNKNNIKLQKTVVKLIS
jgi:surface carbohydrate biosynthesis protein